MSDSTFNDTPSSSRPATASVRLGRWLVCAALAGLLPVLGCLDEREIRTSRLDDAAPRYCTDCHGSEENGNAAPPPVFWNPDAPEDAHQAHLAASPTWFKAIACDACHLVPASATDPGHSDTPLPAELTWGTLATNDDASPEYDFGTGTCSGVYCHGDTFEAGGGDLTQPNWLVVDGSQSACGTCHGVPPDLPHPNRADCEACHGDVVGAEGFAHPERHVDGQVQVGDLDCDTCHGSDGISAPPTDLSGNTDAVNPGVGAHRSHLGAADWHAELTCDECHVVPSTVGAEDHLGQLPADLTWGDLATADGADPDYDFDNTTCSGTYCHGATFDSGGGSNTEPDWTVVDGSQVECGTCHGLPPGGGHVQRSDCHSCHGEVIDEDLDWVSAGLHINGQVDVIPLNCTTCHGSDGVSAPPPDTRLNADTVDPGVGAHRAHLAEADWHATVPCSECHAVPSSVGDAGHTDTPLPAELIWGPVASADDAMPEYDGDETTCNGVYCHGGTFDDGDGTNVAPVWTIVDGSQDACGTCHGLPPGGDHPSQPQCSNCHGSVIDALGNWVDPDLHINGVVNFDGGAGDCDTCHGGDGESAPPVDLDGNSSPSIPGVGAHRAHVEPASWHRTVLCSECHVVPDAIDDPGHLGDPPADIDFSGVAVADSANPAYSFSTFTCTGAYCHGATLEPGGSLTEPIWTESSGGGCGDCHSIPPEGDHPDRDDCASCHDDVIDSAGNWVDPDLHINGVVDL